MVTLACPGIVEYYGMKKLSIELFLIISKVITK